MEDSYVLLIELEKREDRMERTLMQLIPSNSIEANCFLNLYNFFPPITFFGRFEKYILK